jgi:zinc protease
MTGTGQSTERMAGRLAERRNDGTINENFPERECGMTNGSTHRRLRRLGTTWRGRLLSTLSVLAALPVLPALAQDIDRTRPPALTPASSLRLPAVQTATLPNGLRLYVVEMHEVPVVQFTLSVAGGGRQDPAAGADGRGRMSGLASFTANMLDEGADTLDAFGIAAQAEYLGASLGTGANWDDIVVSLKTPKRTLAEALGLMSAVALRPTFRAAEVARQRDLRLAGILQQRDQPETVANLAFAAILFPETHPYHYSLGGDSLSTVALDSARVREFYRRTFDPRRTTVVVSGDITLAEARRAVVRHFGAWRGRTPAPAATAGRPAGSVRDSATAVFLVDKPDAAQSVIRIGSPGVARSNPDYFAIEVMNTILGGSFSSRLNSNLRETKGYTYGARSGFAYRPLPGPFSAGASVRTDVTDSSLVEFFNEMRLIRDSAVSDVELARAKAYLALGLAGQFETAGQLAGQIGELLGFGLPLTYYNGYVPRVMAVTTADVQRVARKYLRPDRVSVVVVGDLAKIRPGIEALRLGPVSVRDLHGKEVTR